MDAGTAWVRLLSVRTPGEATAAGLVQTAGGWRWADEAASEEAALLARLYTPLCLGGGSHVVAQLGQSLDGFIATRTGDANFVTGADDRQHLHRVRALVDAVIVGAGTAVADDPQLTVRAVPGPHPVRVVVDPRGRVPVTHRLFTDRAAPTLWLTSAAAEVPVPLAPQVEVVRLGDGTRFEPAQLLAVLAERGLGRVLVEGGGETISTFLSAHLLDRLYLTVSPVLIGNGVPGVRFAGADVMREAIRPPARRFLLGDDVLFELDLSTRQDG